MASIESTWDGLPIALGSPRGATVVVRRAGSEGEQFLLMHRHHDGPEHVGDWAWTPPAGVRLPGEPILHCAARELGEETSAGPQRQALCVLDRARVFGVPPGAHQVMVRGGGLSTGD